jgi:DNA-binding transcriptional MerR regulator
MEWFPRRQTVVLTRSSPSRLAYLERSGIISPQRLGLPHKPEVFYSWEQILEIRAINRLRKHLSFQAIRKIIQYFDDHGFGRSLRDKHLLITGNGVSWIRPHPSRTPEVIQLISKCKSPVGQLVLVPLDPSAQENIEVWSTIETGKKVIDFEHFRSRTRSPQPEGR